MSVRLPGYQKLIWENNDGTGPPAFHPCPAYARLTKRSHSPSSTSLHVVNYSAVVANLGSRGSGRVAHLAGVVSVCISRADNDTIGK